LVCFSFLVWFNSMEPVTCSNTHTRVALVGNGSYIFTPTTGNPQVQHGPHWLSGNPISSGGITVLDLFHLFLLPISIFPALIDGAKNAIRLSG